MNTSSRNALSLLEMVIVIAIFGTATSMVLQTGLGVGSLNRDISERSDLRSNATAAMRRIGAELTQSAWYLPDTTANLEAASDRDLRYYPFLLKQEEGARGLAFTAFDRPIDDTVLITDYRQPLPRPAHQWASQELIFVKAMLTDDQDTTTSEIQRIVNMNEPVTVMEDYDVAPINEHLIFSPGDNATRLTWERDANGLLIEYGFAVLPDPTNNDGSGHLVLQHVARNESDLVGSGTRIIDDIIARDVDRVVFDTYRSASDLNINQIRVTLYQSRLDHLGVRRHLRSTAVFAMRNSGGNKELSRLSGRLGAAGHWDL